jgi:hypothetical protein
LPCAIVARALRLAEPIMRAIDRSIGRVCRSVGRACGGVNSARRVWWCTETARAQCDASSSSSSRVVVVVVVVVVETHAHRDTHTHCSHTHTLFTHTHTHRHTYTVYTYDPRGRAGDVTRGVSCTYGETVRYSTGAHPRTARVLTSFARVGPDTHPPGMCVYTVCVCVCV